MQFRGKSLLVVVVALGCVKSEVTPVTTETYAAREEGCSVQVFPSTVPSYPFKDLATAEAKCHFASGRTACIDRLKSDACKQGGDTLYGFKDGKHGEYTIVIATIARRDEAPPTLKKKAPEKGSSEGADCDPICSPGFTCKAAVCVPQCNPACETGARCGNDRLCHPVEP